MELARDFLLVWRSIANGVTHQTSQTRKKCWGRWCSCTAACKSNPFLHGESTLIQTILLTGFAARVRTGAHGYKHEVTVQTVSQALAAITASIELGGERSPCLQSEGECIAPLRQEMEGFRREDPPAIPQLAVPVTLIHHIQKSDGTSKNPIIQATADLICIAFFCSLRVGECAKPRRVRINGVWKPATRTRQFRVGDVGFFKCGKVLPRRSPLHILLSADAATLKTSNQKNGRMGQTIHQESTGPNGAVAALARRVHHILENDGDETKLICDVFHHRQWLPINRTSIVVAVKKAATALKPHQQGIDPDLIGSHSLRAGGAMALKLNHHSDTTIQKLGRWSSATWLQHIHNQTAHLSHGVATKMNQPLPCINIGFIEPAPPQTHTTKP